MIAPQGHSVWPICPVCQVIDREQTLKFLHIKWDKDWTMRACLYARNYSAGISQPTNRIQEYFA